MTQAQIVPSGEQRSPAANSKDIEVARFEAREILEGFLSWCRNRDILLFYNGGQDAYVVDVDETIDRWLQSK